MKFKLPKFTKLPHLPRLNIEPVRKAMAFLIKHKIPVTGLVLVIAFITVALWYRGYLISKMNAVPDNANNENSYSLKSDNPLPSIASPTPSDTPDTNSVLGASTKNPTLYNNMPLTLPTPFPTFAPLPTIAPLPITTTTTTNTSSNNNNSGNPNCTTGSGVPNTWYSDVYPNPPVTTSNGSITLLVYIRDCNKNTAPVNDSLTITLTSSDSTAKINGSSSPVTIQAQNGQASFTVSSQNNITDTFTVQDTTSNFTITDINNHNPNVTFTNAGSTASGNSNCTTTSGTPNFWYSEVSPTSPISANTGSTVTLTVNIKDCGKNNVSSDNLTFSQTSNDSSLTVNGSSAPVSIQAQNGVATFTVSSTNAGTDTFTIQDTTSNFTVTDANNHSPSIVFSGSSSTATPTPVPSATPTPSPAGSPTPSPSQSATPTPSPTPTPT